MLEEITILSFTILLWVSCHSVLKVANDKVEQVEIRFKDHVSTASKRENGSVTVLGASITMVIALVAVYFTLASKDKYLRIKDRSHTYLCQYSFIRLIDHYLIGMVRFNRAIEVAYIASKTPPITGEAEVVYRAVQVSQAVYHYAQLKKLADIKWCNNTQKLLLTTSAPYIPHAVLGLKRDQMGRAIMRRNKWKTVLLGKYIILTSAFVTKENVLKSVAVEEAPLLSEYSGVQQLSLLP